METNEANEKLMTAVIRGDIEAAIEAITAGANIHQKTIKGNNLLYVAASRMQEDMFDWLLEVEVAGKKIDLNTRNNTGATTLMELISEGGFLNYVKKLLDAGADPNIPTNDGMSPLIQACADRKFDEVQVLLEHNADVNYVIPDTKTTAFLMAASQGSMAICEILKEKNANVNAIDAFGKNALITAIFKDQELMKKKEKIEHKALCMFLADIGIDIDYVAPSGMTALWAASFTGNKDITNYLLDKGAKADVWHEVGLDGRKSAIHIWANTKEEEIVRKLYANGAKLGVPDDLENTADAYGFMNPYLRKLMLELNADVNAIFHMKSTHPNEIGNKIPVISHIINGGNTQRDIVKQMISRGAKVTFEDEELQAYEPIMLAIASSAVDIVKDLIETKQIDLNRFVKMSSYGSTISPLMMVVSESVNKGLNLFLERKKQFEILQKAKEENDKNGIKSPLINEEAMAIIQEELESMQNIESQLKEQRKIIYKTLVANGANLDAVNEDGRSAIFFCTKKEYASWLKRDGANLYLKDKDGNNPLVYAVLNNKTELIEFLKEEYSKSKEATISKNATVDNIFYQLAFAQVESYLQQDLLEQGILNYLKDEIDLEKFKEKDSLFNVRGINYQDEDGNSGLLVACANNLPFLVSLYVKLGADINLKNNNDETPIMHAISTGNERLVEFLVDKGADLNAQTKDGKTVLEFAEEVGNKQILEKIKSNLDNKITVRKNKPI